MATAACVIGAGDATAAQRANGREAREFATKVEVESARRAGAHGLAAAGDRAVPTLLRLLRTRSISPLVLSLIHI